MFSSSAHRKFLSACVSIVSCAATLSWVCDASAQTPDPAAPVYPQTVSPPATPVVAPVATPVATTTTTSAAVPVETREEAYMPNPYLLSTGLILWGVPYTSSVVVAAQSSNPADQHLYIPIVGPWIDLGNRQSCPVGSNACNNETTNKVLLGVDGAFQAIGTIEVLWAFLRPEHREVTTISATRYTPAISLAPSRIESGYGVTALARF